MQIIMHRAWQLASTPIMLRWLSLFHKVMPSRQFSAVSLSEYELLDTGRDNQTAAQSYSRTIIGGSGTILMFLLYNAQGIC